MDRESRGSLKLDLRLDLHHSSGWLGSLIVPTHEQAARALHGATNSSELFGDVRLPAAFDNARVAREGNPRHSRTPGKLRPFARPFSPTLRPKLLDSIVRSVRPRCVVELGVYRGATTLALADALDRHGLPPTSFVLSVDTWLLDLRFVWRQDGKDGARLQNNYFRSAPQVAGGSQMYIEFLFNVIEARKTQRVLPLQSSTLSASHALLAAGFGADAVYIDASHASLDVFIDAQHWWPLVRCGGVMWGDDFFVPAVAQAVKAFAAKHRLQFLGAMPGEEVAPREENAWVFVKECQGQPPGATPTEHVKS